MPSARSTLVGLVLVALGVALSPATSAFSAPPHPAATSTAAGPVASRPSARPPTDHPHFPSVDLRRARSEPRRDSVYPSHGDPVVDALRYELRLGWQPASLQIAGAEALTFRATRDARSFRLDLADNLDVSATGLDGHAVTADHDGDHLVIHHRVQAGHRYLLRVHYAGEAEPLAAPTTRSDIPYVGLAPDAGDGSLWTIQEPYGASTWYAVNDQPSDKAFYDFDLATSAPQTGIANGVLLHRTTHDGVTSTWWHLGEPAAAYLSTLAFGDYRITHARSQDGVPFTFATPTGDATLASRVRSSLKGLDWLEKVLGPYPFGSMGVVIVPSDSAEETETMLTIGDRPGDSNAQTLVHEMAHQWYGDDVTPNDWRDVWMNEGMATYIQARYVASHGGESLASAMRQYAAYDSTERKEFGPAGRYDPRSFASGNVYYGPAVMWDQLRKKLGHHEFFAMVRAWPASHAYSSQGRGAYIAWIQAYTHRHLRHFFHAWLLGATTPPIH